MPLARPQDFGLLLRDGNPAALPEEPVAPATFFGIKPRARHLKGRQFLAHETAVAVQLRGIAPAQPPDRCVRREYPRA